MTDDLCKVWVVIPAFNEAGCQTIVHTVRSARHLFSNVVVVDDCSTDDTGELALMEGAHVCRHPINLGQGAALATGIRYALGQGATEIITFDADGQHSVEDAKAMVLKLRADNVDVILGSRFLGTAVGISLTRHAILKAATIFTRFTTGLSVTDTHNGLRVFNRTAAMAIKIKQNRMAHASEILHQIADLNLSYAEQPNSIVYTEYANKKGQRITGIFTILFDLFLRRFYR